jgi:hypothetical protein
MNISAWQWRQTDEPGHRLIRQTDKTTGEGRAMNRAVRDFAIVFIAMAFMMFFVLHARSGEQTRFYDAQGNSLGTGVPQSDGSVRYYDSRGNSLGTSTTRGGTTTFYGPGGSVTGKTVGPAGNGPFGGARR